jgi:hypothetical protein
VKEKDNVEKQGSEKFNIVDWLLAIDSKLHR